MASFEAQFENAPDDAVEMPSASSDDLRRWDGPKPYLNALPPSTAAPGPRRFLAPNSASLAPGQKASYGRATGMLPSALHAAQTTDPLVAVQKRISVLREICQLLLLLSPLPKALNPLPAYLHRVCVDLIDIANQHASSQHIAQKIREALTSCVADLRGLLAEARSRQEDRLRTQTADDEFERTQLQLRMQREMGYTTEKNNMLQKNHNVIDLEEKFTLMHDALASDPWDRISSIISDLAEKEDGYRNRLYQRKAEIANRPANTQPAPSDDTEGHAQVKFEEDADDPAALRGACLRRRRQLNRLLIWRRAENQRLFASQYFSSFHEKTYFDLVEQIRSPSSAASSGAKGAPAGGAPVTAPPSYDEDDDIEVVVVPRAIGATAPLLQSPPIYLTSTVFGLTPSTDPTWSNPSDSGTYPTPHGSPSDDKPLPYVLPSSSPTNSSTPLQHKQHNQIPPVDLTPFRMAGPITFLKKYVDRIEQTAKMLSSLGVS